jgi:predicted nucleic acid-binding protein
MYVLDTSVISELMRAEPEKNVLRWAASVDADDFATTAICKAEILYGIAIMPDGRRRAELEEATSELFDKKLAWRVYPFDSEAAEVYARLRSRRTAVGRPMKEPDAQIAAIAAMHSAVLVTRNVADFERLGLELINPWAE